MQSLGHWHWQVTRISSKFNYQVLPSDKQNNFARQRIQCVVIIQFAASPIAPVEFARAPPHASGCALADLFTEPGDGFHRCHGRLDRLPFDDQGIRLFVCVCVCWSYHPCILVLLLPSVCVTPP
jgi:hypothetical protein